MNVHECTHAYTHTCSIQIQTIRMNSWVHLQYLDLKTTKSWENKGACLYVCACVPACVRACMCVCTIPPSTPAENVYFTDHKKHPQLPAALISVNQPWMGPWHACHPSTPQQSAQSPHLALIQHQAKDTYQLSATPGVLLKPYGVFVLLSCNSICLKNRICTRHCCFLRAISFLSAKVYIFASSSASAGLFCLLWFVKSVCRNKRAKYRNHALLISEEHLEWEHLWWCINTPPQHAVDAHFKVLMIKFLITLVLSIQSISSLGQWNHNYVPAAAAF